MDAVDQLVASDYDSDFTPDEEEILNRLLLRAPESDNSNIDSDLLFKDIEDNEGPRGAILPRRLGREQWSSQSLPMQNSQALPFPMSARLPIQLDNDNDIDIIPATVSSSPSYLETQRATSIEAPLDPVPQTPDLRSPLERFRTKPKKALSVTDLISPSWCELQYWYTLTKHGRKRRTPAMKQGSAVHKTLEDQIHTTVKVDVGSKEDAWGLRIWNVIQGLNTLREWGATRELEVWGVLDGCVVNGVIDEVSHICPDREMEAAEGREKDKPAADQASITDFLHPQAKTNGLEIPRPTTTVKPTPKVYLTDVKTRGVKSLPQGASFRPTLMQLMLYHRLLADLATGNVDPDAIFDRYALRPDEPFTDSFIAQMSNLSSDTSLHAAEEPQSQELPPETPPQDSLTTLLSHNSLRSLWALMISEFELTMPAGKKSISPILKAEYRSQTDGAVLGAKTFAYDGGVMEEYLKEEMRWWRGEREAKGVVVEEAYKCGHCDFAEECVWRRDKIEEHRGKMRRFKSVV